jgi:hypothetical protein
MSFRTDVPTAATRHLSNQSAHMKPFQQTADRRAFATTFHGIDGRFIQCLSDVGVSEATYQMVAIQDGLEQFDVRAARRVEARVTSTSFHHRFGDFFDLPISRRRVLDHGQRLQVALVGSQGDLAVAIQIDHALVHRAPRHFAAALTSPPSPDAKLSGIVDDGLDPQDNAELVVHLQPVVFHPMLDPGAGPAIFLATGEHLPVKPGMEPSAQERQDVLGREIDRGVVQQPRVETSQRLAAGEDQIGCVLSLVNDPIIIVAAKPSLFHQRVNLANQAVEDLAPVQMAERIGQLLSGLGIVQGRKSVVSEVESDTPLEHLLFQPRVTVDIDLDGEREPSGQADVDLAQISIHEVEVEHALGSACVDQSRAPLAVDELEAGASLHAAEDADQSIKDGSLSQDLFDEFVLAVMALKKSVFSAGLLGQSLGIVDEGLGLVLGKGHEVAPPDLQDVIDEALEGRPIGDGQVALEDHAVKTREHSDDQTGKLDDEARKRFHGVLLQVGCLDNTILKAERRFCSSFLVAAPPR